MDVLTLAKKIILSESFILIRKEYQKAFEYFSNAKVKSRGRCFKMVWGEKYSQAYKELLMKFGKKSTKKR